VARCCARERSQRARPAGAAAERHAAVDDFFGVDEGAIPALRSDLALVGGRIVHTAAPLPGVATEINPPG
jgi:hypothetical protein